jgi:hypothetical protein
VNGLFVMVNCEPTDPSVQRLRSALTDIDIPKVVQGRNETYDPTILRQGLDQIVNWCVLGSRDPRRITTGVLKNRFDPLGTEHRWATQQPLGDPFAGDDSHVGRLSFDRERSR